VIIAEDTENSEYMLRKLVEEYMKWGLQIIFGKTEYLTLDTGAGIVTETGQIRSVNKFKYLGSILEATGATTLEIEKRISEGRKVIGMLNAVLWSKTVLHKTKKLMYQALVQSILLYGAETWSLNTKQANKLLATETEFWRRSARKSRKEKVRNVTIREVMEVRKNILEVIEEKRLRWFVHVKRMPGNRLPLKVLEWEPEGTRRRGRPKERWTDGVRRSMTNHGLKEEVTRDRDRWRNLVLGEGQPL
jgi:hypothetical protein